MESSLAKFFVCSKIESVNCSLWTKMGLYQVRLLVPLIELDDNNKSYNFRLRFIKDHPEQMEKFVTLPEIKPIFEKYVEDFSQTNPSFQDNSENNTSESKPVGATIPSGPVLHGIIKDVD